MQAALEKQPQPVEGRSHGRPSSQVRFKRKWSNVGDFPDYGAKLDVEESVLPCLDEKEVPGA